MREIFPGVVGNDAVKENIGRRIADGERSHAYIISGAPGSGKMMLARMIAAAAACEHRHNVAYPLPCGECDPCRRTLGGISADTVLVSSGDRASIGVDEIRALRAGIYTVPNDSDVRTYIIENAERMTAAAQNALLLTLEEPPSHALFLILTEDEAGLLETVRSRSILVRTERLSDADVGEYLFSHCAGASPDKIAEAVKIGDGSIGRALSVISDSGGNERDLHIRNTAAALVDIICRGGSGALLRALLGDMPRSADEAVRLLSYVDSAIRDIIAVRSGENQFLFHTSEDSARTAGGNVSKRRLFLIHDSLCDAILRLRANVSVRVVLTDMALSIT